ncbi:hypothetical protein HQ945_08955 [Phyllobacterium sp. BT25]|uniref:Uncharacterized protein n=1 Tax=Phyllobacterium pellucidum TaxID=2740464 RepID=A0A849VTM4_9HYPH|nr:hypothetical protein [Phyllobacterium pellucidum]NTS31380.1 hypothetical protein [Phyllobacterium pellucidum]
MSDSSQKKMARAAAKAPAWLRTGAAARFDPQGTREFRTKQLGTFGAASDVRKIDPSEYENSK